MFLESILAKVLQGLVIPWGELSSLSAGVLLMVYGELSPSTGMSVERERIIREIARLEGEIEKFKRLASAA
jgi:hypothetical protein